MIVVPGRVLRRTEGVKKPFYRIKFNKEVRTDLAMWIDFLQNFNGKSVLLPEEWESSDIPRLNTNVSGLLGFAACLDQNGLLMSGHKLFYLCKLQ